MEDGLQRPLAAAVVNRGAGVEGLDTTDDGVPEGHGSSCRP